MHFKPTFVLIVATLAFFSGNCIARGQPNLDIQKIISGINARSDGLSIVPVELGGSSSGGMSAASVRKKREGIALVSPIGEDPRIKLTTLYDPSNQAGPNTSFGMEQFDEFFGGMLPKNSAARNVVSKLLKPNNSTRGVSAASVSASNVRAISTCGGFQRACGYMMSNIVSNNPTSMSSNFNSWPSYGSSCQQGLNAISNSGGSQLYVLNASGQPQPLYPGSGVSCFGGGNVFYQNGMITYQPSSTCNNAVSVSCPYARGY